MHLQVSPGLNRLYRVALVGEDEFTTLSEHDDFDAAVAAMKATEAACERAAEDLERVLA